jgi:uncharacterized protein
MKTINVTIKGMTCVSCEVLLERKLRQVDGVKKVKVSKEHESATINCEDYVTFESLKEKAGERGYTLFAKDTIENSSRTPFIIKNSDRFAEIGSVLLIMIAAYFVLKQFNLIPEGIGVTENMSYGFIFLIGLVAATSTCLAVAGGLLLAVANKYNKAHPDLQGAEKFKPHIWFNIGRVVSYVILGGAIGALGSFLSISTNVTGIITIVASVLMVIMGLQLLGIFPWLNKIQIKMPKFLAHKIYDASNQESKKKGSAVSSFLFGGATFFLPCGFTQALQIYVLGQGSFMAGALTMLAFSLGTLPALAGIGVFSSFAKGNTQKHFMTFSAVLVIGLGAFNFMPGLTLLGVGFDNGGDLVDISDLAQLNDLDEQVVKLEVRGLDYYPQKFTIKKGVPVRWEIDGTQARGCAQILSVPSLGITEYLPGDKPLVLEFTPEKVGKIMFTCNMGMAGPGVFEVI